MIEKYNAIKVEKKWREYWVKSGIYKVKDKNPSFAKGFGGRRNFYHLTMFPYPSGNLHMGHWYNYAPANVFARLKRMQGYNVLSPIGFDAFGLPAENAAIARKIHPKTWTYKNIKTMREQLKSMGNIYDFSREVITADSKYYKWTQWMFLQMHKAGLAYKKKALANWCPKDQVILANEQVIDGRCWRHPDTLVIQKEVNQWMLKITDYAEELLKDLDKLDWPERTKLMQKNWIGKSEGTLIKFEIRNLKLEIPVFTTRADTLFGATYMVLSPEHPLVEKVTTKEQKEDVRHYIANAHLKTELERTSLEKEKTGVFTGSFAFNPANQEEIPIWVSDYVLMNYGTGAIMAVPAHDERDFEFAKKFNLPTINVIEDGLLVNSGEFTGLESVEGGKKITEELKEKGLGSFSIQYKMRDWVISRQRYWGAPIPIIYCEKCGIVPVQENKLPVKLPPLKNFKPVAGGKSPLARVKSFVNVKCPNCKGKATRETDTMDTFVDSSWYFLRYTDPKNKKQFASKDKLKAWLPVDMYVGGAEHAVLHLLYSRFFVKALRDSGYLEFDEPFVSLRHQGDILGSDGQRMSKSRGNVVDPDELVKKYGADTVRMYLCFMGEYSNGGPWNPNGILGIKRFLDRVWNKFLNFKSQNTKYQIPNTKYQQLLHQTIKKVGDDIEHFRFNTAISALMILFNEIEKTDITKNTAEIFLKLLSPFAPHFTEELWQKIGNNSDALRDRSSDRKRRGKSIHLEVWPKYDPKFIEVEEYDLVIQVNGKMRDKVRVSKKLKRPEVEEIVLSREIIKKYISGAKIKKTIFVPGRLINVVI
ncbi:MAG: leucine--tRNA ligase [Parcubacteria group bacterium]|nr:leucine--tRNA ligase [Parcubacteria group bacterium]